MDTHTLNLLDFEKVRGIVASYAACSLGKDLARQMVPSRDLGWIRAELALTTEMSEAISSNLSPPFGGLHDIRPHVRRAQVGSMLEAEELAESVETLHTISNLSAWLAQVGEEFPRMAALRIGIGDYTNVINEIEACLDSRGTILDTASRKLSSIRRDIAKVEEQIQETLKRMLRSPEIKRILRFPNFTMVGHHYVLPISKDHRGEIQGSVHRTSASNETVYIEPQAIAERSAELSFLRAAEAKEIRRILRFLSAQLGHVGDSLLVALDQLAQLDLVFARGRYSLDYQMSPPDLNDEGRLALRGARHPLLEYLFREEMKTPVEVAEGEPPPPPRERRSVVPIDVHLGLQFRMLIVTGPNTGGKTVALKTMGLIAMMAQCGLHIPANQGSQVPVFDEVLADIGDEQSIEQSLSTFSSHVRRVCEILRKATEHSLVLMDEMGAGTDPNEGAALGRAILDELDSIGCRAVVTTHIGDLKTYAFTNPRAENAAVEFDIETLRPRYRVHIGDIGQSNALQIARRLDLPDHLINRAAKYLEEGQGRTLPEMEIVQKLRKDAEAARQAAMQAQAEAERSREALNQRLGDLQKQSENDERLIEARARLQPGDRVVVARFGYDRPGRVVKIDVKKKTALIAIGRMEWTVPIEELIPQLVKIPDVPQAAKPQSIKSKMRIDDFVE